ncbi:MAG: hypothetical protein ACI4SF_08575 [Oscillospiraceae bacterium]
MKIDWKRKLSSRKFWAAVSGVVIALMVAFGADANSQEKVTGVIAATGTLAIYMLAEGSTDKAAVNAKADEKSDSEE